MRASTCTGTVQKLPDGQSFLMLLDMHRITFEPIYDQCMQLNPRKNFLFSDNSRRSPTLTILPSSDWQTVRQCQVPWSLIQKPQVVDGSDHDDQLASQYFFYRTRRTISVVDCAAGIELRDHDQLPAFMIIPLILRRVNPAYHLPFHWEPAGKPGPGARRVISPHSEARRRRR